MRKHTIYPEGSPHADQQAAERRLASLRQATEPTSRPTPVASSPFPWPKVALGVLIGIAIVLYAVQAPVLGAVYGAGPIGMLLALPASLGLVVSYVNARAGVGLVLLGTVAIAAVSPSGDDLPFPWTVPSMLALFACCIAMGLQVTVRQAAVTWSMMIGISLVVQLLTLPPSDSFYVVLSLSAISVLIGAGVKLLRASEARAEAHAELGAQERERREILEEKAKVARELHDVVAHHMSVISVQAASAEYRLEGLTDEAREEFRAISEQSRSSLAELRRILGVLRGDDESLALAPQPGVADLPRVIEHVGRAGTTVELTSDDLFDLPDSVSIATYRIVQEALSNVVRHAPGASAKVVIERGPAAIDILVVNPAGDGVPNRFGGTGHGLRGMRERAAALGGTLTAAPLGDGGFEVRAWLPVLPSADDAAYDAFAAVDLSR